MELHDGKSANTDAQDAREIALQLEASRAKFLSYVRGRISDPDLAEDILQESLLKALRSAREIRDEERLLPWFYHILQNAVIDAYRRKAAETSRRTRYAHEVEVSVSPQDESVICECLHEIIPTIKPEYAEVAKSIDLEGQAPEEVARRLGISRNNLKVRVHRARRALRKRLEEICRVCAVHHCLDCTCKQDAPSMSKHV